MTVSSTSRRGIDYAPCRYNGSRLWFRGPLRSLRKPYVACLGGCEVYGRFVHQPLSSLLEAKTGQAIVNLGVEHAGVDAYLHDPGAMQTIAQAKAVLLQITGCQFTSNRFYSVHPRRNDRFLRASQALIDLYPDMDFTEIHFTGHLVDRLYTLGPDRFGHVQTELRKAWRARVLQLVSQISQPIILFQFRERSEDAADMPEDRNTFPDDGTVERIRPHIAAMVDCVPPDWRGGADRMEVPEMDAERARHLPGPDAHQFAATQLADTLTPLLSEA